jgi:hypothetical protein
MAFDLKGVDPQDYHGEWIRFNIWIWPRVWKTILKLFPQEDSLIKFWYLNAGEHVNEEVCNKIADRIEQYGTELFARDMSKIDLPTPHKNINEHTIFGTYAQEIEEFILFLRSCRGFYLT